MNDENVFDDSVGKLLRQGKYSEAEQLISSYHRKALAEDDKEMLNCVFRAFVHLYCSTDPPNLEKAEHFSMEREKNSDSSYNKLQTAMFFFYVAGQYERAVAKLEEAIARAKKEKDVASLYSSTALLGQAFLKLGRTEDAAQMIVQLHGIITSNKGFPVGDETAFLQAAKESGVEILLVRDIAGRLAPRCSDPDFAHRLWELSK